MASDHTSSQNRLPSAAPQLIPSTAQIVPAQATQLTPATQRNWVSNAPTLTATVIPVTSSMASLSTSDGTVPTVNAVPVMNNLSGHTVSVNSTQNLTLPLSTAASPMSQAPIAAQASAVHTNAISNAALPTAVPSSSLPVQGSPSRPMRPTNAIVGDPTKVLDKQRLQELVKEVDPLEQLDDDVEELLLQMADDFIENVVTAASQLAKHRKASTVEVKDVQLHLERNWNMWIPGYGSSDEGRPYKKAATSEAHKQRMALIKKSLKKY